MKEGLWIYTTTRNGFDIFAWNEWLNSAAIQQLYIRAADYEKLYQHYTNRNKHVVFYREHEANAQKAHFYHRLVVAIHKEISLRLVPMSLCSLN